MNLDVSLLVVRLLAGGVFVIFGIGKFTEHASELVAMLVLLWSGPGAYSLANELNHRRLRP